MGNEKIEKNKNILDEIYLLRNILFLLTKNKVTYKKDYHQVANVFEALSAKLELPKEDLEPHLMED